MKTRSSPKAGSVPGEAGQNAMQTGCCALPVGGQRNLQVSCQHSSVPVSQTQKRYMHIPLESQSHSTTLALLPAPKLLCPVPWAFFLYESFPFCKSPYHRLGHPSPLQCTTSTLYHVQCCIVFLHTASSLCFLFLEEGMCPETCGILVIQLGIQPTPLALATWSLTLGIPGKSLSLSSHVTSFLLFHRNTWWR